MNVLEPCAFCGGAGHVYEDGRFSSKPYDFPKWYIICEKCGIRTPIAKMEQVVRIWNRRAKDESSAQPEKVCIARINLSEEQVHEAIERAKNEIVQMLPSAQPDNQINLCDSCDYLYPECPSEKDDVIFGNGIGNDNICACNKYKPSAQPEQQHGRIFQEIVVRYPSYNPYPERQGKPYFSIKYTENGQEFIGYSTYKPEVLSEYLKEYFMTSAQPEPSEITDEQAILHLQSTGWMQNHDREIYESGLKEQLADDSESYDSLIPYEDDGDTISRQMAIDAIMGQPPEPHYPSWYAAQIEELPATQPVTNCSEIPNSSDDTISRRAAIDALDCINGAEEVLRALPSAQPEIIRCKDCKHRDKYGCCKY